MAQVGRDSIYGIAARSGLEGLGFKPPMGRGFSDPSRLAPKSTLPPIKQIPGLFLGGRVVGMWN